MYECYELQELINCYELILMISRLANTTHQHSVGGKGEQQELHFLWDYPNNSHYDECFLS